MIGKELEAAIGDAPEHIAGLRKLAVAFAIGGRFDYPSTAAPEELLTQIEATRKELERAGQVKKRKGRLTVQPEHLPEAFNDVSRFVPLAEIASIEKGKTGIKQAVAGEFPLVVTAAARETCDHFDFDAAAAIIPLVSSTGHGNASINRLHYQEGKFALGTILAAVIPHDPDAISARFLFEYLSAFKDELLVSRMTGTANVTLTIGRIGEVPVPLLSAEAQSKVDELMALCDRLEEARKTREELRDKLTAASLARLTAPDTSEEDFPTQAAFALEALPALTTRPDQIKTLRQTIFNLAVRGKLTFDHKTHAGVAKASDLAISQEKPYSIHSSWTWAMMDEMVHFQGGSQPPKSTFIYEPREGYTRLVQIRDFKSNANLTFVPDDKANRPFSETDVMIGRYGPPVFQILRGLSGTYNVALMKASPKTTDLSNDFLFLLLQESRIHDEVVAESQRTAGQTGVRLPLLRSFLVGIPPLTEQHRIVAKVDALMALCDRLEAALTTTDTTRTRLLEALLHEALAPAAEAATEAAE